MRLIRSLAVLPFLAFLIGPFFVDRVTPAILGLPLLLAAGRGGLAQVSDPLR
jgi:hypothetical protein